MQTEWFTKTGKSVRESKIAKVRAHVESLEDKLVNLARKRKNEGESDISLSDSIPQCMNLSLSKVEKQIFDHMILSEFAYVACVCACGESRDQVI